MRTLILGIGNTLLTDEGVGIHVLQALETALAAEQPPIPDITLLDGGTLSFTLAGPIEEAEMLGKIDFDTNLLAEVKYIFENLELSFGMDLDKIFNTGKS